MHQQQADSYLPCHTTAVHTYQSSSYHIIQHEHHQVQADASTDSSASASTCMSVSASLSPASDGWEEIRMQQLNHPEILKNYLARPIWCRYQARVTQNPWKEIYVDALHLCQPQVQNMFECTKTIHQYKMLTKFLSAITQIELKWVLPVLLLVALPYGSNQNTFHIPVYTCNTHTF